MGANAQTTVPTFTAAQVLTAAQMNQSARTGVPVFATTTDRDAAFGGTGEKTLAEGQLCVIEADDVIQVYTGAAWVPYKFVSTGFTPTFTNLTLGNGAVSAGYIQLGKLIHMWGQVIFGSTTSITGTVYINFPITASGFLPAINVGTARLIDAGVFNYEGAVVLNNTTRFEFAALNAGATYAYQVVVNATVPFTWGNGDLMFFSATYEAA